MLTTSKIIKYNKLIRERTATLFEVLNTCNSQGKHYTAQNKDSIQIAVDDLKSILTQIRRIS